MYKVNHPLIAIEPGTQNFQLSSQLYTCTCNNIYFFSVKTALEATNRFMCYVCK